MLSLALDCLVSLDSRLIMLGVLLLVALVVSTLNWAPWGPAPDDGPWTPPVRRTGNRR